MSGIIIIRRVSCTSFRDEVYLTRRKICRNCNVWLYEEPYLFDITTNCFKNKVENIDNRDEEVNDKSHKTFKYFDDSELITSSRYFDSTPEVQEIHQALKVDYKNHELEIFKLLKDVCDTHNLPLARTWAVATERNIELTCNSFNTICIGKAVCMTTTDLPFYFHNSRFRHFQESCRKHHLLKSKVVVGRALSSHGFCFCEDVTKLQEGEYPLVHLARMSGLSSCFAVYLHSNEHTEGYVLEFFLPVDMKEDDELQNQLVQMMKIHFKFSSLEFGELSSMEVIGMQKEATQQLSAVQRDFGHVSDINQSTVITNSEGDVIMNTEGMFEDDATSKKMDVVRCNTQRRKRKMDYITPKPIGEASRKLDVNRPTTKDVSHELSTALMQHHRNKYSHFSELSKLESDDSIEMTSSQEADSGDVYQTSPKKKKVVVNHVSDTLSRMVTVKASFKDDMVKFEIPISSGVLELKKQVARRFEFKKITCFSLKYMDEDSDLILISTDADFHNLIMPFSAYYSTAGKNTTIKLIVEMGAYDH